MHKVILFILVLITVLICAAYPVRTLAQAAPAAIVDCGNLRGEGVVVLVIDELRYRVLIQCPASVSALR